MKKITLGAKQYKWTIKEIQRAYNTGNYKLVQC